MKSCLSLIKSSFHDIRCCDENKQQTIIPDGQTEPVAVGWRPLLEVCLLDYSGKRTGYKRVQTIEQYVLSTLESTGQSKTNAPSDSNYIADYISSDCAIELASPTSNVFNIQSNAPGKGRIHLTHQNGTVYDYPFISGTNLSVTVLPGYYDISIQTFNPDQDSPSSADIVIGQTVYPCIGDVPNIRQPTPLYVHLWPIGDGQSHIAEV